MSDTARPPTVHWPTVIDSTIRCACREEFVWSSEWWAHVIEEAIVQHDGPGDDRCSTCGEK